MSPVIDTLLHAGAVAHVGRASWLVPERIDQPELLDLGIGTPDEVNTSLADLWRINRFLGGIHTLTAHLYPRLCACERVVTIADIGAGSAQIAAAVAQWANRRQLAARVFALDLSARHLDTAHAFTQLMPHVHLIQADALQMPFKPESVDYVISSLFLHHFPPEQVVEILRSTFRFARHSVIMSDLIRGWIPLALFKAMQPVFARSYLTRHDGVVSIRRAYTPSELFTLANAAGLSNIRVHQHHPWWRMTLTADK